MNIKYEVIADEKAEYCRELCNELMVFQKSKAKIQPEMFDSMNFNTRMIPSMQSAIYNQIVVAKDEDKIIDFSMLRSFIKLS
jgi:hypothetical protein